MKTPRELRIELTSFVATPGDRSHLRYLIEQCRVYEDGGSVLEDALKFFNTRWKTGFHTFVGEDLLAAAKGGQPPLSPHKTESAPHKTGPTITVKALDNTVQVHSAQDLRSPVILQIRAGTEMQLGETAVVEGREWMAVTVENTAGYVLAPSTRGHTTLEGREQQRNASGAEINVSSVSSRPPQRLT